MTRFARICMLLPALALILCGCNSPGIQPQVHNNTDSFEYQVSNVKGYTGVLEYAWTVTGPVAVVNQATSVTGGTMTLTLLHDGRQVYSRSLAENGTFETTADTAGTWTIRVTYQDASGTVNFRVQKKT
ncbi:MAG: hypothetical protein HZB25_04335 [Candidatus Eisenbacteria bacterium]|nr:hypothetical protein [Candidatus Eisenbacteria bacterium]